MIDLPHILRRIAAGDAEAFAQWYESWFDQVYRTSLGVSRGDVHAAEDITQEVLLRFVRRPPFLEEDAAMGAWLKRTALRVALDRARSESRRTKREAARGRGLQASEPASPEREEQVEWLMSQLEAMGDESALAIMHRVALGRTLARVGAALGVSASAIDGRIARATRALRRRWDEVDNE